MPDHFLSPSSKLTTLFAVSEPPEPPSAVFVTEVTSRSVTVSWSPAYDGNTPILGYMIQYRDRLSWHHKLSGHNLTVPGTATEATLTGLEPYTEYQVEVFSRNSVGVGSPSKQLLATTSQEAPSGPPQSVRVEPISATELRVTWQPPRREERNGLILGYYIRYARLGTQMLSKQTIR